MHATYDEESAAISERQAAAGRTTHINVLRLRLLDLILARGQALADLWRHTLFNTRGAVDWLR